MESEGSSTWSGPAGIEQELNEEKGSTAGKNSYEKRSRGTHCPREKEREPTLIEPGFKGRWWRKNYIHPLRQETKKLQTIRQDLLTGTGTNFH